MEADTVDAPPARRKIAFDVTFGIMAPILCLAFDPIVFQGFGGRSSYASFAYLFIGFQLVALVGWLTLGRHLIRESSIAAGFLFVGFLASFGIGTVLLPLSFFGTLIAGIGLFGFTPFFTAYVFLGQASRAWKRAGTEFRFVLAFIGAVAAVAFPVAIHEVEYRQTEAALATIMHGNEEDLPGAVSTLRRWGPLVDTRCMLEKYDRLDDPLRKRCLAGVFESLTGSSIESALSARD